MMSIERFLKFLSPFIDSELDARTNMEVEEQMARNKECRRLFEAELRLEKSIKEHLTTDEATQEAWERALQKAFERSKRRRRNLTMAVCSFVVVVIASTGYFRMAEASRDLSRAALNHHQKYLSDKMPLTLVSDDPLEVSLFLKAHLDLNVRIPSPDSRRVKLLGARLCHLNEVPVAYVVYHVDHQPVSVFVMDRAKAEKFRQVRSNGDEVSPIQTAHSLGSKKILTLAAPDCILCAVGEVSDEDLRDLVVSFQPPPVS